MKRLAWQFLATLIVVAVLLHFIWWLAAIAAIIGAIVGLGWFLITVCQHQDAVLASEAQRQAALRIRADQQQAWVMQNHLD